MEWPLVWISGVSDTLPNALSMFGSPINVADRMRWVDSHTGFYIV